MMILKVTKNKALHSLLTIYFLKYILKVKAGIFLKCDFNISFCQNCNLLYYSNKNNC